jgi:hypothetical protein
MSSPNPEEECLTCSARLRLRSFESYPSVTRELAPSTELPSIAQAAALHGIKVVPSAVRLPPMPSSENDGWARELSGSLADNRILLRSD